MLIDTNVVLDLLLDREPWSAEAAKLFTEIERGAIDGYLAATTITTIHYLASKTVGATEAQREIRQLLALCSVAPIDRVVLEAALELGFTDYEDAVLHEAARSVGAEIIVTRNARDFSKADLRILTPAECVQLSGFNNGSRR